jgi:outer membrane protein OmpA-like peptidoglycan-associated protein
MGQTNGVENAACSAAQLLNNARAAQEGRAMSKMTATRTRTAILSMATIAAALAIGLGFGIGNAFAGDNVTEDQILRALAPAQKPLTRGLSIGPQTQTDPEPSADESKFVQTIRGRATRSLSTAEREEIATIAKSKPNIDLEITFDYNSADISQKSMPSVQALGRALSSPDLKGSTFIVAGHTDAAGTEAYNQDLSERRADSIKRYLIGKYGIAGADLVTVGYGKSKLKDPSQPLAEVNRRVQVVNMENKSTASK